MKYKGLALTTGLTTLLIMGSACSANKTAQLSPVASSGDGKGTAPPAADAKKANEAMVRFVNATPSSKDLSFGDATPFANVGARDVTEYKLLPAQRRDLKLFINGDDAKTLATNSEGLTAGKHYTVLAVTGKDGTFSLDPVKDDLTPPSEGKAKVRVINLAPGYSNVDLYSDAKKSAVIGGAGLDRPTDYKEIVPSDGTLDVRNSARKGEGQTIKDVQFEAGKLYTVLVFEDQKGKLKVKTIEDEFIDPAKS
jgi:hypothetical protein